MVDIPESQILRVIPFVFHGSTLYWYQSNVDTFKSYKSFKKAFTPHYQSEDMSYAKLTRPRTLPFDPKHDNSVEGFVIERYNKIRKLDGNISESQLCSGLTMLLPTVYQRHLSTARIYGLIDLLEAVRKLELIHISSEAKRTLVRNKYPPNGRFYDNRNWQVKIGEVQMQQIEEGEEERSAAT